MSRPTSDKPMVRTHIHLYVEDIERLHKYFDQTIGFSKAARTILHSYLNNIEARAQAQANATAPAPAPCHAEELGVPPIPALEPAS